MAPPPPVKAVLFDADGVIQNPPPGWLFRIARKGGSTFVKEVFPREETTVGGEGDFREILAEMLKARGNPLPVDEMLALWYEIDVDPAAVAIVDELRSRGLVCCLATNQHRYRGGHMQRTFDYAERFDKTYYSFEMGVAKPSQEYFEHVVADLGLAPGEMLFIDDVAANVEAARRVGLRAEVHRTIRGAKGLRRILRRHGIGV